MYDIVALGELLIDFTPGGKNQQEVSLFAQNPGGAPANVLAMNAKLGGKTAFIGKVGDDAFGAFLQEVLVRNHIDISGLLRDARYNTTLAFVQLDEKGDRSFSFYRKQGADLMLEPEDVSPELLGKGRVFHFGSVSMSGDPSRRATELAVQKARELGCLISFDPNYRPLLWSSEQEAKDAILNILPLADLVKVSEEEMELLTGETDLDRGAEALKARGNAALILISLGEKGSYFKTAAHSGLVPTYAVDAIDTTGAGDAFLGALLHRLAGKNAEAITALPKEELEAALAFANAAGALTTERLGAIPAMPEIEQIQDCIKTKARRG